MGTQSYSLEISEAGLPQQTDTTHPTVSLQPLPTEIPELTTPNIANKALPGVNKPIANSTGTFKLRALELQVMLFGLKSLLLPPLALPKKTKIKTRKPRVKHP